MRTQADADKAVILIGFARLDGLGFATALAAVFALFLFLATAALILAGPGGPNVDIGVNLSRLGGYFPGYTVSWLGAFIGAVYAAIIGFVTGAVIAILWNMSHFLYITLVVIRSLWWKMMAD